MKRAYIVGCIFSLFTSAGAVAQSPAAAPTDALVLNAYDTGRAPFDVAALREKVAVVFFWSTACAICRDSLPELRANLAGWRNKPFALVTVNVDRSATDWLAYEKVLSQTRVPAHGVVALRQMDGVPAPAKLPLTLLVNAKGRVVARYEGRMAPEVWDSVADLLP